jgi:hypothetical protein
MLVGLMTFNLHSYHLFQFIDSSNISYTILLLSNNQAQTKENLKSTDSSNEDDKESKEPDYDEDEDQLEEEQEEGIGEITINQVF